MQDVFVSKIKIFREQDLDAGQPTAQKLGYSSAYLLDHLPDSKVMDDLSSARNHES